MQLGEYKVSFLRNDIRGSELLSLQRRDLRELGVTKVGHLKRILKGIENLKRDFEFAAKMPSTENDDADTGSSRKDSEAGKPEL